MSVLNINKLMHEFAYHETKTNKISYNVSRSAVLEMTSYLEAILETKMGRITEELYKNGNGRKTITEEDILNINARIGD